ncbi:hypothetical protein MD484_g5148, partial [Candolleomyces efflorescens]
MATFFLAMLCYPDVQEKAFAEVVRVLGPNRLPTFEDKSKLPYITAIAKESLRWQSPNPIALPHMSTEEDIYKGYRIPKGSMIIGNVWALMHNEEDFPNPMEFKPERFLNSDGSLNESIRDPATAVFGFGRRLCPGRYIALSSLWITVASVVAAFRIERARDDDGKPIEPKPDYLPGIGSPVSSNGQSVVSMASGSQLDGTLPETPPGHPLDAARLVYLHSQMKDEISQIVGNEVKTREMLKELQNDLSVSKRAYSSLDSELSALRERSKALEKDHDEVLNKLKANRLVVLIDGDGAIFDLELIAQGEEGGHKAASLLSEGIAKHLPNHNGHQLWVYVFLNKRGLSETFDRVSEHQARSKLDDFMIGFNQSTERFIMVDVGSAKEAADSKIKVLLESEVRLPQTESIIFAGCHDNGYVTNLRSHITSGSGGKLILLQSYDEVASGTCPRYHFVHHDDLDVGVDAESARKDEYTEDEETIFEIGGTLFRFDNTLKQWKERGSGTVSLLLNQASKRVRLLMQLDKTLEVCANHFLNPDLCLHPNAGSDQSWVWKVPADYAENPPTRDQAFAIRFSNSDGVVSMTSDSHVDATSPATPLVRPPNTTLLVELHNRMKDEISQIVDNEAKTQTMLAELQNDLMVSKRANSTLDSELARLPEWSETLEKERDGLLNKLKANRLVVLIDGDGAIFNLGLISQGQEGGHKAALLLSEGIMKQLPNHNTHLLSVYVFLNKRGLSETFSRVSEHQAKSKLDDFMIGFNQSTERFIMVDVGGAKEAADAKIKGLFHGVYIQIHRT